MKFGLRFFIPLIGITAVAAGLPAADMLSVSGHARTKLEFVDNQGGADTDATERWLNRVRLNLDIAPSKTLAVRLAPELAHTFGPGAATGNAAAGLTAREAWMSWQATDMVKFYIGRQTLNYGHGKVIGDNDRFQVTNFATGAASAPNYFDAVRAQVSFDLGKADFLYAKITETPLAGSEPADTDLFGVYSMMNPDMGIVENLDAYAFWYDDRTGNGGGDRYGVLGLHAEGNVAAVSYDAEVITNFGKTGASDDTVKGLSLDVSASGKLQDHTVGLGVTYANSEARTIAPSDGASLGRLDAVTRNNIMAFAVNTAWKLHEKWSAYVDGFYFLAAKDDLGTAGGLAMSSAKRSLALEADLGLSYKAEKNLTVDVGYSLFKGMDAIDPNDKSLSAFCLGGTLTF